MRDLKNLDPRWEVRLGNGPVLATAVHNGHQVRDELRPLYALSEEERRREEDPLTGVWTAVGDDSFRCHVSRFEVDLNRPPEQAVYVKPEDAWGLEVWRTEPSAGMVTQAQTMHSTFHAFMKRRIEKLVERFGKVLLLDLHSYNHRRSGPDAPPAPPEDNPDIDLGLTTANRSRFGSLIDAFCENLQEQHSDGRRLDVRPNVRYPDGGHWPEWVCANYGDDVCAITLEYKKFFMDEWSGNADLSAVEELKMGLWSATNEARRVLKCQ